MKAIVVFDSKYGNCKKVAEDIAGGLAEAGAEVNIVPVREASVGALAGYEIVAVGAPVRIGKPLKRVRKFVANMQDVPLDGKTLGFFDTYGVAKQPGRARATWWNWPRNIKPRPRSSSRASRSW